MRHGINSSLLFIDYNDYNDPDGGGITLNRADFNDNNNNCKILSSDRMTFENGTTDEWICYSDGFIYAIYPNKIVSFDFNAKTKTKNSIPMTNFSQDIFDHCSLMPKFVFNGYLCWLFDPKNGEKKFSTISMIHLLTGVYCTYYLHEGKYPLNFRRYSAMSINSNLPIF